jgi:hypothetical protein
MSINAAANIKLGGEYGVNVSAFGAKGDGQADDAPAIQQALDSAAGRVVVGPGRYRIGSTLRVPSRTHLSAHPRAQFVLADGAGRDEWSFLLANRDAAGGDHDIEVTGGIWNGNCLANPRGADERGVYTGTLVNFINVRGLVLGGMTLIDAESYYLRLGEVSRFLVEHITFEVKNLRPNQDGVHLGGFCDDGIIRHIRGIGQGATSDDIVALNADDACGRAQNLNLKCGPIRRVAIHDISADDCHTFVRLLTSVSDIDQIDIENVRGGCRVSMLNADACRKCRVKLFDADDPSLPPIGRLGRVRIRDVEVYKTDPRQSAPLIDLESDATDLVIENFRRDAARDGSPRALTLMVDDISPRRLELGGIDAAQAAAVRGEMLGQPQWLVQAQNDGRESYLLRTGLCRDSHLELPHGGFGRLAMTGGGA